MPSHCVSATELQDEIAAWQNLAAFLFSHANEPQTLLKDKFARFHSDRAPLYAPALAWLLGDAATQPCSPCRGTGFVVQGKESVPCPHCNGKRYLRSLGG